MNRDYELYYLSKSLKDEMDALFANLSIESEGIRSALSGKKPDIDDLWDKILDLKSKIEVIEKILWNYRELRDEHDELPGTPIDCE